MSWNIDLGFVSIGSQGVDVKPQLKFGVTSDNFDVGVGIGDVRDGISLVAGANAKQTLNTSGSSINECIDNIKCDNDLGGNVSMVLEEVTKFAIRNNPQYSFIIQVAGDLDLSAAGRIEMTVTASTGVGVSATACLGWCDTNGYHMVGAGGEVAVGIKLKCDVMAGMHHTGRKLKAVLGFPNVSVEIIWFWPQDNSVNNSEITVKTPQSGTLQFDSNYYYRIWNIAHGNSKCLDVYGGDGNGKHDYVAHLADRGNLTGQYWKIEPADRDGYFFLTTRYKGTGFNLDVINGGSLNYMQRLSTENRPSGQYWKIESNSENHCRLTTLWTGENTSLDINSDYRLSETTILKTPCDSDTQYWVFELTDHRI